MTGEPPDRGKDGGGRGAKSKNAGRGGRVGSTEAWSARPVNNKSTNEELSLAEQLRLVRVEMKAIRAELETSKKRTDGLQQCEDMSLSQPAASSKTAVQRTDTDQATTFTVAQKGNHAGNRKLSFKPFDLSLFRHENFTKYHVIEVDEGKKRKLNPFRAYDDIKFQIKGEPEDFSSIGRDKFLVTVKSKQQSEDLKKLRALDSVPCRIAAHKTMNYSKGLIYVREFDIDEEDLRVGLADQYVTDVKVASWIKTKNESVKPFLITFASESTPEFIKIPGESFRTVVHEYIQRPMQCRKCQQYGHTMKWCTSEVAICGKCATPGHITANCQAAVAKCVHCEESHYAWNSKCKENIFQAEVTKTQTKEKISRRDAVAIVRRRFPDRKTPFSGMTRERQELPVEQSQSASTSRQPASQQNEKNMVAQKRKLIQVSSPISKNKVTSESLDSRGKKRREEMSRAEVADVSMEESDFEEDVLRQIYDSYVPDNGENVPIKPRKDNDMSAPSVSDLSVGMIKISKEATKRTDQVIKELERYKVARLYFVPSDKEYTHALIMSTDPLPDMVEMLDGKLKQKVTLIDNFSEEQEAELKRIIKS